jgi:hypothetical protein
MARSPTRQQGSPRAATTPEIDLDKLRARLRRLKNETIFYMLDDAIELLPPARLVKLVSRYIRVEDLRPDEQDATAKRSLLGDVKAFDAASHAGQYYESFDVNSKNFMELSRGTRAFIADYNRILDRCVAQALKGPPAEVREAFDILFSLLRYIDEYNDAVIFFADEAGSWQVRVAWAKVFPAWFLCLSRTSEPDEYAHRVVEAVDEFEHFARDKHLAAAKRIGTAAQRKALGEYLKAGAEKPTRSRSGGRSV